MISSLKGKPSFEVHAPNMSYVMCSYILSIIITITFHVKGHKYDHKSMNYLVDKVFNAIQRDTNMIISL